MSAALPQAELLVATRSALLVMFICYLPHFITAPGWLCILVFLAIGYKLTADYFGYFRLNAWIRFLLVGLCLFILKIQYGSIISSGFFIGFLLTFIALKCLEIHSFRDLKTLVICNFYLIFSALIVIQELWILVYLLVAVLTNFSLMLKLSAPRASLREISGKSMKQLLVAIPLSIILFYVFPRIADPLWQVPSQSQNRIGFTENMNPGSITEFFGDDSVALRITFKNKPSLRGYWRGLILDFYNGISWSPASYAIYEFIPLKELTFDKVADYEIILEPHQKKWLFYTGNPVAGRPNLLFAPNHGLISQNKPVINQRFAYAFTNQLVPYRELNARQRRQNLQLPNANPRLVDWAKTQFNVVHQNSAAFISFLQQYIHQQPFWYTLTPPEIKNNKNQMDTFWFDNQKGFCEHYASALAVILRSAGIPARVIIGYQGGSWNPLAQYLTIQQNDAHAWIEYWEDGRGWQELDPTAFIASERIDQRIKDLKANRYDQADDNAFLNLTWFQRTKLFFDSTRFFAERWLLFYNQNAQRDLLHKIGIDEWNVTQLIQITILSVVLFIIMFGIYFHWSQKSRRDSLLIEYHLLQNEFRRFNVPTAAPSTLRSQCQILCEKAPSLSPMLSSFINHYERLRLRSLHSHSRENKKAAVFLMKNLRKTLRQSKPSRLMIRTH